MKYFLQEKAAEITKQNKEENRKKPKPEEQEGMPHSISTALLLQSVAEIGTQSIMKSSRKILHE
jgi:hypothetical protein